MSQVWLSLGPSRCVMHDCDVSWGAARPYHVPSAKYGNPSYPPFPPPSGLFVCVQADAGAHTRAGGGGAAASPRNCGRPRGGPGAAAYPGTAVSVCCVPACVPPGDSQRTRMRRTTQVYGSGPLTLAGFPPWQARSAEILSMGPLSCASVDGFQAALGKYHHATRLRNGR